MIPAWLGPVLLYMGQGFLVTMWIAVLSVVLATILGVLIGTASASSTRAIVLAARAYTEALRGIPSLMTMLFVFFALPRLGIETRPIGAAALGLGLWSAANIAEAVRGAIGSVPTGQVTAARALGLSQPQALAWVVFPQATRRFLPPYVGQVVVLIQASTLTSIVGVTDLLGSGRQMIERLAYVSGQSYAIPICGIVLAAFFAVCYPLTLLSEHLERRLQSRHH